MQNCRSDFCLSIPFIVTPIGLRIFQNMEAEFDPLYPHTHLRIKGEVMVKENFTLTEDMKFGEAHAIAILAYSIMFVVGLTTNTISLVRMLQVRISRMTMMVTMVTQERIQRKDRSKMTLLLIHLSVADLTVSKYDLQYVQSAGVKRTPLRINYG